MNPAIKRPRHGGAARSGAPSRPAARASAARTARRDAGMRTAAITGVLPRSARATGPTRHARRQLQLEANARNKANLLAFIIPVMLVAKLMVAYALPAKYFFDNNRVLAMALGTAGDAAWGGSYEVSADLFASLNVFGLTSMSDWSFCLGVPFTLLVLLMVAKADAPDLLQSVFVLATVGLLNIYIFTIGKDIIQFTFFLAVYAVLMLPIRQGWAKVLGCAAILYYESTFFREYYVLIAALVIAVYAILSVFRRKKRLGGIDVLAIVAILFATIYAMMLAASVMMPDEYHTMINLRAGYEDAFGDDNGGNMATAIRNWIPGDGLPMFMVNYMVNALRMLVPFELVMKGAYYLPFFAFQCMVTAYVVNLIRQINGIDDPTLFIALCVFLGYVLASVIFEPDFGSWTRHESATFPVLLLLVLNRHQQLAELRGGWLGTRGDRLRGDRLRGDRLRGDRAAGLGGGRWDGRSGRSGLAAGLGGRAGQGVRA